MEITKTDLRETIRYLEDAAKLYKTMDKPKHQWRVVLIRRLVTKLNAKLNDNDRK